MPTKIDRNRTQDGGERRGQTDRHTDTQTSGQAGRLPARLAQG
jgi:hypothetical protein